MLRVIDSPEWNKPLCRLISKRLGLTRSLDPAQTKAIALVDDTGQVANEDDVLMIVAFHDFSDFACELLMASNGEKRQKIVPEYIQTVFDYPFNVEGKSRIDVHIAPDNRKSIAMAEKFGFKREAVLDDYYGEGKPAILYGWTRKHWLASKWHKDSPQQQ